MTEEVRDIQAEIAWAEQFGTAQQAERLLAEYEDRPARDMTTLGAGALVPQNMIRPAAPPIQDAIIPPGADADHPNPDDDTPVREGDPEVESYDDWGKRDLQDEVKVRNRLGSSIDVNQNKPELIAALRDDDAANATE